MIILNLKSISQFNEQFCARSMYGQTPLAFIMQLSRSKKLTDISRFKVRYRTSALFHTVM